MKKKLNIKTAAILLVVTMFTIPMYAQPGRGQRPGQGPGQGQGMQFSEESMKERISNLADTLKLSDQQEKQILDSELKFARTMQSQRENFDFASGDRDAFRAKMTTLREERDAQYKEVLNTEQYAKYSKMMEGRRSQMRERPQREGEEQERSSRGRGR
jgi:Spy/CpxP family protein refolding chaperone